MLDRDSQINLADTLNKTTYVVDLFEDADAYKRDEPYSSGSAVAVNDEGDLITAAHVILGASTKPGAISGREIVVARTSNGTLRSYRIVKCGIWIEVAKALREALFVDLAYLRPRESLTEIPFLPLSDRLVPAGEPVLMAGFSDELEPPLLYDRSIDYRNPAFQDPEHETARKVRLIKQLLMIKSGMVGQSQYLETHPDDDADKLTVFAFYVDNGMHSGASGGPIVNSNGELIGIIVKRAVTIVTNLELDDPKMHIPSGSTLGLRPTPILKVLNRE